MLQATVDLEVADFIETHRHRRDASGRRLAETTEDPGGIGRGSS